MADGMLQAFAGIGVGAVAAGVILALVCLIGAARETIQTRSWERKREREGVALWRLSQDAWWFSRDVPTMNLLHRIADGKMGVAQIREEWEREREMQGVPPVYRDATSEAPDARG